MVPSTLPGSQGDAILTAICAAGLDARRWKDRIYLNDLGADIAAYIEMAHPDRPDNPALPFDGCRLKVWCNDKTLTPTYRQARAKRIKLECWQYLHRAGVMPAVPPSTWQAVPL